jgi:hypothetical protein
MKIALLISGYLRGFEYNIENLKRYIIGFKYLFFLIKDI